MLIYFSIDYTTGQTRLISSKGERRLSIALYSTNVIIDTLNSTNTEGGVL